MTQRAIFLAAVEIADSVERQAYVDEACVGNETLRLQVESLLTAHERPGRFLDAPAVQRPPDSPPSDDPRAPDISNQEDPALDFLEPATKPDTLGRLDQYDILEIIGQGGMGIVFKAFDEALHRVVAIKVMAPQWAANVAARKRFLREAQAAAAVSHDHIVTIFAVKADQPPYLVMEFIEGQSLQEKIDREGPLELYVILRIAHQISLGLAAAHAQRLIHRDVKPSNILLQNAIERVQITDFGLARARDDIGMTRAGEIAGTPEYMSPEQAQGQPLDQRSDLFSLGSVLYTMCAGRPAFRADSPLAAIRRVCDDTPRTIREVNPDIPEWLVEVIDRLLAKDPADRFQTAAEVSELIGLDLTHVQTGGSTPFPGRLEPAAGRSGRSGRHGRRGRRWLAAAVAIVAVVASLGTSEVAGLTQLSGMVIRVFTGEGTLVIEVDDPNVEISLDGEQLRITGAGLKELTLRPGQYQFQAMKDGQPLKTEIVSVSRGKRRVVRVTRETDGAAPSLSAKAERAEADWLVKLSVPLLTRDPQQAEVHLRKADALYDRLQREFPQIALERRQASCRRFLSMALNYQAFVAVHRGPTLGVDAAARAVLAATEAVELSPEDAGFYTNLGMAQYRARNWNAALLALKKGPQVDDYNSCRNRFCLAMVHWQLENKEEARQCYDKAVEWMDQNKKEDRWLLRDRTEAMELLGAALDEPQATK